MKIIDKAAMLIMFVSMSMLDSDTPIPFGICFVATGYLLIKTIRGDLDV